MSKDWTGNNNSVYTTIGASNHTEKDRAENDYYATDPDTLNTLLKYFKIPDNIWECACGGGHLSKRLEELGYNVYSSDLIERDYGIGNVDFLETKEMPNGIEHILTNPPYKYSIEFVNHSLELLKEGNYCIMFLKTTFLESNKRYEKIFKDNPPKYMFQFINRVCCAHNGDFINYHDKAVSYAWFVWEKGFKGDTIIRWIK